MLYEFSLAKILNTMPQLLKICPNSNAPTFLCFENFAPTRMPQLGAKKVGKKNTLVAVVSFFVDGFVAVVAVEFGPKKKEERKKTFFY